ncbi:hypothetical protein [Paraconexibacter sp. AEG42_29]|uniref:hypothetical protein n=1 Tax=Paraconexibacter sp. AEG42_29 TaxID=2997339 RepID=UPI00339D49BA
MVFAERFRRALASTTLVLCVSTALLACGDTGGGSRAAQVCDGVKRTGIYPGSRTIIQGDGKTTTARFIAPSARAVCAWIGEPQRVEKLGAQRDAWRYGDRGTVVVENGRVASIDIEDEGGRVQQPVGG